MNYQQLLEDHTSGKAPLKDCDIRFFKTEVNRLSEKLKTAKMNLCSSG